MNKVALLEQAYRTAFYAARDRSCAGDLAAAFALLERGHVQGQRDLDRHLAVHAWMLRVGWARRDAREVRGQLLRLALAPIGHSTGRLPARYTGGASRRGRMKRAVRAPAVRLAGWPRQSSLHVKGDRT